MDALYVIAIFICFTLTAALVAGCAKLGGPQ
ncbi:MAG: hypothetical protein JWM78_68 [Verrucomicrobiaceae bacterium]|nr:hypothetical protein [Verrucomicrobiaceae bacterium]